MADVAKIIESKVEHYGRDRKALIPILQGLVAEKNYVANDDMVEIARALDISAADVYGTATFFSFIEDTEKGKYVIRVCRSITCEMKGKNKILQAIEKELRIKLGETTHDNKFSLLETNCLGLCDVGPAMLINNEPFIKLTAELIPDIIREYRNKEN